MTTTTPQAAVNGRIVAFGNVSPNTTALDWIRDLGFTGAKEGCAEGECGACAIMVARPSTTGDDSTEWVSINSCLIPAASLDGAGGDHRRGPGHPGGAAPGPAGDGGPWRFAVRLLHAGIRLLYGRRVLPRRARRRRPSRRGRRARARRERVRPARDERQSLPLHGLPADPRRGVRARRARRRRRARGAAGPGRAGGPGDPGVADRQSEYVRPADLAGALVLLHERPDALLVAGSTDWGVEVNIRGAPGAVRDRDRPGPRAARADRGRRRLHPRRVPHPHRARAPARRRDTAARRSCSRSSPRG